MNPLYGPLLDLGVSALESLIAQFTKSNVPAEIIDSIKAAYDKLVAHRNDVVTKANLEAERG